MKRFKIYIWFMVFLVSASTGSMNLPAANIMAAGSGSVGPFSVFIVRVSISNSNAFVAFQFDMPVPAGFLYIANSAAINPSRANGHILDARMMPDNSLRVLAYSITNQPFIGDTGTVMTFQVRSGNVPGVFPLVFTAPVIGDASQVNILTGVLNGNETVLAPDIEVAASSINFDRTPLGTSTTRTITIRNTGNQPLPVTSILFNSLFFEVSGSSSFSIPANSDREVSVEFKAVTKGVYNNLMTISSNDPDEPQQTITLQARAYAVNELHSGTLSVFTGQEGTLAFTVNNMESVSGFQFDVVLPEPMNFLEGSEVLSDRKTNHAVSAHVIPGNILRVVAWSPDNQPFSGNDGEMVRLTFHVSGNGGYYPLAVSNVVIADLTGENCLSDSYNGWLHIAASAIYCDLSLNFGDVSVLETGHRDFRIYNTGNDTLRITQVTFTNPAFSLATPLPWNIPAYSTDVMEVEYNKSTEGTSAGVMKIVSNDPEPHRNPQSVSLTANSFMPNYMIVPDLVADNIFYLDVPVKVSNIEPFTAFQFDLVHPAFLSYVLGSANLSPRASGHILQASVIDSTKVRVIAFSLGQKPFYGDTGTIVTLRFEIYADETTPVLSALNLSGALLGDASGENILYNVDNGVLTVENSILPVLNLANQVIGFGESNCFNALNTITVAGNGTNFTILNGGDVTMIAGQKIRYLPGTKVNAGGRLWGHIASNGNYCTKEVNAVADPGNDFFKIYPNPTSGMLTISIHTTMESPKTTVEVFSILGHHVLTDEFFGIREAGINLNNVNPGIYIIRVKQGEKTGTAKVIKL
jgi:hypothetical protein